MYNTNAVFVYLIFFIVVFVILFIILGVFLARTRKRQRIEQTHGTGEVLGTGGQPLTNEQSPRYQRTVQPDDADVGSNVRNLPTEQDVERVQQDRK